MTAITISLAILLAVPLVAFALIFATGAACGVAAYHLSRQVVVQYQPMRKAVDQEQEKNRMAAALRKMAAENAALQKSYLDGIQMTREQYLAGENGK